MGLAQGLEDCLLAAADPEPVEVLRADGASAFVLSCEHGGRAIPSRLGDLGLAAGEIDRHIGWDIGAEAVARGLSAALDAALVLQRYSRLVIDCNRPRAAADCIPPVSDGTEVPANRALDSGARRRRWDEIYRPFHAALAALLNRRVETGKRAALVAVHSFTPRLAVQGGARPWHLGLLWRRNGGLAEALMAALGRAAPELVIAHNQPYRIDDASDFTIPVHGEARAIPHVLLEIRQDQIVTPDGQARWTRLLADALRACEPQLFLKGA